jgi:ubiquinone/menaquinone biosynthesis C-methylase UbiE
MSGEADRLGRIYERYRRSPRKRRAWDADNPGNRAIRRELLECFRAEIGDRLEAGRLLDVGCGTGWLLAELAREGNDPERLHGVELIETRLAAARRAAPAADIRRADARRLPYEKDSFEVVAMFTVLSSLPSSGAVRSAVAEARRVLVPGGMLLIYESRVPNPLNRATRLLRTRDLNIALGPGWRQRPLTVVPALARRLGSRTELLYRRLAKVRPLLTGRLISYVDSVDGTPRP